MEISIDRIVRMAVDGQTRYYLEESDLALEMPTVAELKAGEFLGTADDEEWTVDVYRLDGRLYSTTYFNAPADKDVCMMTELKR